MKKAKVGFFLTLLAICMLVLHAGHVKISEGVDKPTNMGMGGIDVTPLEYTPPDPYSGPQGLYFLVDSCFKYSIDRWEYEICPFHNVTQRRVNGYKAYLLGVWGHWATSRDSPTSFHRMIYHNGKGCNSDVASSEDKEAARSVAQVTLRCGADGPVAIENVHEDSFCAYNMTLALPISCSLLTNLPQSDIIS